jgi:hypothetical protein
LAVLKKENLEDFLRKLTDKELAFFSKFRCHEFMPESQQKIQSEIKSRSLSDLKIDELTNEVSPVELGYCPRCGSKNFQEIIDTEFRSRGPGAYEVEIKTDKCRICSYNAQKDKAISWKVWLNKFLGKYAWKKLK